MSATEAPPRATCRLVVTPARYLVRWHTSDPVVRAVFGEIERELGFGIVPNIFRAMAGQPAVLRATWDLFRATVLQGTLPRAVKEMIGVAVSAANHSPYALAVHMHSLGVQGVNQVSPCKSGASKRAVATGRGGESR